jgi:hypothetical protein
MPEPLSFSAIRAKHAEMLRATSGPATPESIASVKNLVESVRMAGRSVQDEDDREYLRSLLTFWGNWVYNQTRTYPNTNLEVFVGEGPVKRMETGSGGAGAAPTMATPPMGMRPVTKEAEPSAESASPSRSVAASPMWLWPVVGVLALAALGIIFVVAFIGLRNISGGPQSGEQTATAAANQFPTQLPAPTLTLLPDTGGGGGGSSFSNIAVQVTSPDPGATLPVGQPVEIGGTFVNLQAGWRLFYVITDPDGNATILPRSLVVESDGSTGVWMATATLPRADIYSVSVYIATSNAEKERLQRWADEGKVVTPDEAYDGVILFRDLAFFEAQ